MEGSELVTRTLVRNCLRTSLHDIPEPVLLHAKKGILNWMGVAIGASRHPSVEIALQLKSELRSSEQASILGRPEKADLLLAPLINGMSSHIFDYDDTHLDTIHHPSSPVAPIVFALGERYALSGESILRAYILGCEAELRISRAVYPSHYERGWHSTGTIGVFGATVAAGELLGFNEDQMTQALGIAGTQAAGLREMFGTMAKPLSPGKAAHNGMLAALLAQKGFTSAEAILEGKHGFASVMAPEHDLGKVSADWGSTWELRKNTFKPYACGVVLHPSIDACIALGHEVASSSVDKLVISVNPYVLELTGKTEPRTGLEGKFSIHHAAAVSFLDQDAGEEQFSDKKVMDPTVTQLRRRIETIPREEVRKDEAFATLILRDGSQLTRKIRHATGSADNPLSPEALATKFSKLSAAIIGHENAERIVDSVYRIDRLENIEQLVSLCTVDHNSSPDSQMDSS